MSSSVVIGDISLLQNRRLNRAYFRREYEEIIERRGIELRSYNVGIQSCRYVVQTNIQSPALKEAR
jgi:hypothetical protein